LGVGCLLAIHANVTQDADLLQRVAYALTQASIMASLVFILVLLWIKIDADGKSLNAQPVTSCILALVLQIILLALLLMSYLVPNMLLAPTQQHQLLLILPEWTASCLNGATGVRALFHAVAVLVLSKELLSLSLRTMVESALPCASLILATRMLALFLLTAKPPSGVIGKSALEHAAVVTPSDPVV
jgi:hypothetical protein